MVSKLLKLSVRILYHRVLWPLVENETPWPVADCKYFQGYIRKVSVGDKKLKLAVFNLLLVILKVENLMRIHYKNNITNRNNVIAVLLFLWQENKVKINPKKFINLPKNID